MARRDWENNTYHCAECGRRMYRRTPDGSGSVRYGGHGKCTTCCERAKFRAAAPDTEHRVRLDWSQPQHCLSCQRPMRRKGTPATGDGTVQHQQAGRCRTCHRHAAGPMPDTPVLHDPGVERYLTARRRRLARQARRAA